MRRSKCFIPVNCYWLVLAFLIGGFRAPARDNAPAGQVAEKKIFRAGAATSNITPKLGCSINGNFHDAKAVEIHDELHARCLVLDDGQTRFAFVVVDSCLIPREIFDRAKQLIQQRLGLPPDQVLISSTHCHSAPSSAGVYLSDADKDYIPFLIERIADGVTRAVNHLAPARITWGVGSEPGEVFNRRWKMKPGAMLTNPFGGTDQVRMNPPVANHALLEPAGPTDPGISFISIQSLAGRPIALLANYSLHYVGGVPDGVISADYYGAFAGRMAELLNAEHLDPEFVAIMSNGTSGDVNNINFRHPQKSQPPYGRMRLVADAVATEIMRVLKTCEYRDWVGLKVEKTEINVGIRHPSAADLERAREILAKTGGRPLRTLPEIYARETTLMNDYPPQASLIIQTVRIGDLAIVAIPCEVFAETGLRLKAQSPFKPTFTISLANGWNGYLPTPEQHKLGGYETWRSRASYLETGAATKIADTALDLLGQLK